jgi:hypothetical protein
LELITIVSRFKSFELSKQISIVASSSTALKMINGAWLTT